MPNIEAAVKYDGRDRALQITVDQTQHIDERTPAFRFTLPVYVRTDVGEHHFEIDVREQHTAFNATLDGPPQIVAFDPWMHVLKTIEVDKPLPMWITQAKDGPTIQARHEAVRALADTDTPETIELVAAMITDDSIRYTLRGTAVATLKKYGSEQARERLLALATDGVEEARVRVKLVEELRDFEAEQAVELLAKVADTDESYATRVAAIEGLAHHESKDHIDLLHAARPLPQPARPGAAGGAVSARQAGSRGRARSGHPVLGLWVHGPRAALGDQRRWARSPTTIPTGRCRT